MTPQQLIAYYVQLLIIQYISLPRATATVATNVTPFLIIQNTQRVTFDPQPTSGSFTLSYNSVVSGVMQYNSTSDEVQTALRTIPDLANITVQGSMTTGFTIDFTNVLGVTIPLVENTNSLLSSITTVVITITQTEQALPTIVSNAFNIDPAFGPIASGKQLDIIGKYVGVTRSVLTNYGNITLADDSFLILIQFAIILNDSGSSLADIQANMSRYFEGEYYLFDSTQMFLTYFFNISFINRSLLQVLISENLLPKPMGVGLGIFIVPNVLDLFGFWSYSTASSNGTPFNNYVNGFDPNWKWLSYADQFV